MKIKDIIIAVVWVVVGIPAALCAAYIFWAIFVVGFGDGLDIDAPSTGFTLTCQAIGVIGGVAIAFLGVAFIPLRAVKTIRRAQQTPPCDVATRAAHEE